MPRLERGAAHDRGIKPLLHWEESQANHIGGNGDSHSAALRLNVGRRISKVNEP